MDKIKDTENKSRGSFEFARYLDLLESEKQYAELMNKYRCAIMEVETKLNVLNVEFSLHYDRNPFESIKSRLKSPVSIMKKLQKKCEVHGKEELIQCIEDNLFDVAGVRVICAFQEDIYHLADLLLQQDDVHLIREKDYIKNPKENGYRSLHLILEVPVFQSTGKTWVKVEVQFRTIGMDFWASVDHKLRYKKNVAEEEMILERLRKCADVISSLDDEMQNIRTMIEAEPEKASDAGQTDIG